MVQKRRLRFSLRTLLLLVTAISIWLGWQFRIVYERREVRRLIGEAGGFIDPPPPDCAWGALYKNSRHVSWFRQLLGDESLAGYSISYPQLANEPLSEGRIR